MQYCQNGDFAYVLSARQMGKSSLITQAKNVLVEQGTIAIFIDLTAIGRSTAPKWYYGLVNMLRDKLEYYDIDLNFDIETWWDEEKKNFPDEQKLIGFLTEIVLEAIKPDQKIIIFVDEIDYIIGTSYSDSFFAAVRSLYNLRAHNENVKRLSFVFVGAATPNQLMRDPSNTPFNIGKRVNLSDFSYEEAKPLAKGLNLADDLASKVLEEILNWTGGHPYLTLYICNYISQNHDGDWHEEKTAEYVRQLYFVDQSEQNINLRSVRDKLLLGVPDGVTKNEVLKVYQDIRRKSRPIIDNEQDPIHAHLKISGIVKPDTKERLVVRNRIYETVFDNKWILSNLDKDDNTKDKSEKSEDDNTRVPFTPFIDRLLSGLHFISRRKTQKFSDLDFSTAEELVATRKITNEVLLPHLDVFDQPVAIGGTARIYFAKPKFKSETNNLPDILIVKLAVDSRYVDLLVREAEILLRLKGQNVPHIYPLPDSDDYVGFTENEFNPLPYIVMDYVPGKNLAEILGETALEVDEILGIMQTVADTLKVLHEIGYAHYDIKPPNILIDKEKKVTLIDFGTAEIIGKSPEIVSYTDGYSPPERGSALTVEIAEDVYSFSMVMLRLLLNLPSNYNIYKQKTVVFFDRNISTELTLTNNDDDEKSDLSDNDGGKKPNRIDDYKLSKHFLDQLPNNLKNIVLQLVEANPADRPEQPYMVVQLVSDKRDAIVQEIEHIRAMGRLYRFMSDSSVIVYWVSVALAAFASLALVSGFIWFIINDVLPAIDAIFKSISDTNNGLIFILGVVFSIIVGLFGIRVAPSLKSRLGLKPTIIRFLMGDKKVLTPDKLLKTEITIDKLLKTGFTIRTNVEVGGSTQVDHSETQLEADYSETDVNRIFRPTFDVAEFDVIDEPILGLLHATFQNRIARLIAISKDDSKKYIDINTDEFIIGRQPELGIDLAVNEATVSAQHCSILYRDGKFYVRDHETANGTWINGVRVGAYEQKPIKQGDQLRLGKEVTFQFDDVSTDELLIIKNSLEVYELQADGTRKPVRAPKRILESHFTIGNASDNFLPLDIQGISRYHAVIAYNGSTFTIEDLGSTNGTWIQEKRQPTQQPISLVPNTLHEIRLGSQVLLVFTWYSDDERTLKPPNLDLID